MDDICKLLSTFLSKHMVVTNYSHMYDPYMSMLHACVIEIPCYHDDTYDYSICVHKMSWIGHWLHISCKKMVGMNKISSNAH